MKAEQKIGIFSLALLITSAIDSIRNMPTTALFGPQLVFFAILGALFFLIPVGLVAAELGTGKGLGGGIYSWVKRAMGEKMAFLSVWLQWINVMVWYPTILSFIAGTAAYLINPQLINHAGYLVAIILCVFWGQTLLNLQGIKIAAQVASWCAIIGMVIPMLLILVLGFIWMFSGLPLQIQFTTSTMLPHITHSDSWISLTAIITSFLGMELAAVHVKDVENANKAFPRALACAAFFILATTILCSLVISWVLPQKAINLVAGTMQVFSSFFNAYHIAWLLPVLAVMIVVGSFGSMVNWIIAPARGLLFAAEDGFLPKFFSRINRHGMPHNVLLLQAVLVSVMCLAFTLMPSVNGSYWLLTDLSTELYLLVYILMFIAALILKFKYPHEKAGFTLGGGKIGMSVVCGFGLFGCLVSFCIGFLPPGSISVGTNLHYVTTFAISIVVMIVPVFGFIWYKKIGANAFRQQPVASILKTEIAD